MFWSSFLKSELSLRLGEVWDLEYGSIACSSLPWLETDACRRSCRLAHGVVTGVIGDKGRDTAFGSSTRYIHEENFIHDSVDVAFDLVRSILIRR